MNKRSLKSILWQRPAAALVIALLALLCVQCERRPLEVYYEDKVAVRIDVDWMKSFGIMPSGMTVMLYRNGDSLTYSNITNEVLSHTVQLDPGLYKLIIFNQRFRHSFQGG